MSAPLVFLKLEKIKEQVVERPSLLVQRTPWRLLRHRKRWDWLIGKQRTTSKERRGSRRACEEREGVSVAHGLLAVGVQVARVRLLRWGERM